MILWEQSPERAELHRTSQLVQFSLENSQPSCLPKKRGQFLIIFSFAFQKLILNYFFKCSHLHTHFRLPLNQSRKFFPPQCCFLMVDLCYLLDTSSQISSQVSVFSPSTLFCSEQLCLRMSLTLLAGIIVIILAVQ